MKGTVAAATLMTLALPIPASANSKIKIDMVPSEYTPVNSPTNREPVSISSFHFEIDRETSRARVVVNYTYPDQMIYGPNDDVGGPRSTFAQIPGLRYDAVARAIVYDSGGAKTVCATVNDQPGFLGRRLRTKNTGACGVSGVVTDHAEDTGWDIRRFRAIDVYLEVR
jgi:hypothetical protein